MHAKAARKPAVLAGATILLGRFEMPRDGLLLPFLSGSPAILARGRDILVIFLVAASQSHAKRHKGNLTTVEDDQALSRKVGIERSPVNRDGKSNSVGLDERKDM